MSIKAVAQGAGCCEAEFRINAEGKEGKVYLRVVRSVVLVAKVYLYLFPFLNYFTYALLIICRC